MKSIYILKKLNCDVMIIQKLNLISIEIVQTSDEMNLIESGNAI